MRFSRPAQFAVKNTINEPAKSTGTGAYCTAVNSIGIPCLREVSDKVRDFSKKRYGKILCYDCQQKNQ